MFSRNVNSNEATLTSCPDCYSKGEIRVDCTRCSGCGKETCHECGGQSNPAHNSQYTPWKTCLRCDGSGREKCGACHGTGYKWGPCVACEGAGELTLEALEAIKALKQAAQQQREDEKWQFYGGSGLPGRGASS